jgi:hypothetical protein
MAAVNALAALDVDTLLRTKAGYSVADSYHPHRYDAHALGKPSPRESWLDDRKLRHAIELHVDSHHSLTPRTLVAIVSITLGTQAAANFRPGYALALLRRYAPDAATVLDTSTGYGGRLLGFCASQCTRYVGIDPSSATHAGNERLAAELCPAGKSVELHCLPAEDVDVESLRDTCDVAVTSPPYFAKEHYCDEPTQSAARYSTAAAWRDGFLRPMLRLQHAALKSGSVNVVNIADVRVRSEDVPLVRWTCDDADEIGFVVESVESYTLLDKRRFGANQHDEIAAEPVIVMRKP